MIVSAVGVPAAPKGHAYVFDESERLARPILFEAARGVMDEAKWTEWFKAMATPAQGLDIYGSQEGLAWKHNTEAFLRALYVDVTLGDDKGDDVMLSGLGETLRKMP